MSKVRLIGSTSGYTEITSQNVAGDNTITLPSSNGSANQLLKNGATAGSLEYSTVTVDSNGGLANVAGINNGPLAGFRNAIINGNFDIWQRGTSFSNPGSGSYLADRWLHGFDGSGSTRTISRQTFATGQTDVPGEPSYFFRYNQSVAGSGGTDSNFQQRIESVRTFAGQQITISFYAKAASSITLPFVRVGQVFGSGGSPSATVSTTLVSNLAIGTSWAKYSYPVTLPSISGKTLGTNGNDFVQLVFSLPLNTTFTFDIAQVQVEAGPVATPFERRPIGTELALCQRYYEEQSVFSSYGTATFLSVCANYKVTKRVVPTTVVVDAAGNVDRVTALPVSGAAAVNNITQAASSGTVDFFRSTISGASGVYGGSTFTVKASAEL